jgi:hypothetical protein
VELVYSPFWPLLVDAIELAQKGRENAYPWRPRFARTSIMCSSLLPEAAANCCIESLAHQHQFRQAVDRLPALAKLELFLGLSVTGKMLDRGDHRVQEIEELRKVRDTLVHPKRSAERLEPINSHSSISKVSQDHWPALQIDKNPARLEPIDAIRALAAVTGFFNLFFVELCEFTPRRTVALLLHDLRFDGQSVADNPDANRRGAVSMATTLYSAVKQWNITFDFLGVNKTGPALSWFKS